MNDLSQPQQLTVSQLNRLARQLLEDCFGDVEVTGELSSLSRPSSGHWYFTLKDSGAQLRCAFFRNRNMYVRFKPETGQQLKVKGKLSLYEGRGDYQLIVDSIEPAGNGELAAAFEALKSELQSAGWFEQQRKRQLPERVQHIAVVTSPTGAALQDIAAVLQRRWPAMRVTVLPVMVQGEQAADQICAAVYRANHAVMSREQDFDVLLLSRGGGSLEDLWPFNERRVAQALFDSVLPTVSAVGHEVDFSISDFVADVRAPTPSAAAELLSPDQSELLSALHLSLGRLQRAIHRRLSNDEARLVQLQRRIRHPRNQLQAQAQRLDEVELRLSRQWRQHFRRHQQRLAQYQRQLVLLNPQRTLREDAMNIGKLADRLKQAWRIDLNRRITRLSLLQRQLSLLGPQQILERGYSILLDDQGVAVTDVTTLTEGDVLRARLARGSAELCVTAKDDQ